MDEQSNHRTILNTLGEVQMVDNVILIISTVPEKFQRRKEESLDGLDGMKPFQDDILIYGCGDNDKEDYDRNLEVGSLAPEMF